MAHIVIVVAPILFVLLTTLGLLAFAPVAEEPPLSEQKMNDEVANLSNHGEGGKVILFRPASKLSQETSSTSEIVACLEEDLRRRQEGAQQIVSEIRKERAAS